MTSPDVIEKIKAFLGNLENTKSEVKNRQSFSAFLDPSINEEQTEFFEDLYNRQDLVTYRLIVVLRNFSEP